MPPQTTLLKSCRINELRRLNRTIPACRLPPTILQNIFFACAELSVYQPTWSWVDVTNVCFTWRRAALSCRNLWSFIDFSHPRWTFLTLHRSTALPVFIRATVEENNQHSIQRALQHASRIREVHLISSLHNIAPLIGVLHSPNHFLESLIIDISQPHDNNDIRFSKRTTSHCDSPLPSLKYLELHRTPISLVSQRYIGLTHLSLHHLPSSERPAHRDFFSFLERFTMLQSLTLERAFPKCPTQAYVNCRPIQLPHLCYISLTGSIPEITNILDGIVLQATSRIRCHVDRMMDFKSSFQKLAKVIGAHFHRIVPEIPLDSLVIIKREESLRFTEGFELNPDFRQSCWMRAFGCTERTEALLDLVLGPDGYTSRDEVLVGAVALVWEALPLAYIDTLTLLGVDIITHRTWSRLLPALTSLRVLEISGYSPSGLLWALLLNARSHSHLEYDDTSALLLPKLDDIYIHNVDCFAGGLMVSSSAPVNSHFDLDDSRFLDVFFSYLEDRQRCSLEPRSLSISRCHNVSRTVLWDLKKVVAHLSWDGRGLCKEETSSHSNATSPATYRSYWSAKTPLLHHYFRLQRLLELD